MKIDPRVKAELRQLLREKIVGERQRVTIISSYPLDIQEKNLLLSYLPKNGKEIHIQYRVDPSVLAGIVIQVGTKLIDLSVKGQLANLQQMMHETT